jgi:MULE transposase domain/SWIM zinc finger
MVLLTDSGGIDSPLITIKKQSARERAAASTSQDNVIDGATTSLLGPVPTTLAAVDSAAEAQAYAKNVRESLRVGNGSVLLAIAWMTEEELRIVSMYPEVLASDVTEQTNKEKRSLVMLAGLTSAMKSFTACRAFLPSCCSWVFDWFFATAIPALIPAKVLQRNVAMYTDGDSNEYNAFLAAKPMHYPNSSHRLCSWHLINRGMRAQGLNSKGLEPQGCVYFEVAVKWIKSWCSLIESDAEFSFSYSSFMEWLALPDSKEHLQYTAAMLHNFVLKYMMPHRTKWMRSKFMKTRSFERRSTQFCEVENSVMKTCAMGPRPNQSIDAAASAITKQNTKRLEKKFKDAALSVDAAPTTYVWEMHEFENSCNAYVVGQVQKKFERMSSHRVLRRSDASFFVQSVGRFEASENFSHPLFHRSIIPYFSRVREVTVHSCSQAPQRKLYLKCSCGMFDRFGYPCVHIYLVLNRDPVPNDVVVRYHKVFAHCYGNKDHNDLDDLFEQTIARETPGPVYVEQGWPVAAESEIARMNAIFVSPVPIVRQPQVPGREDRCTINLQSLNCEGIPEASLIPVAGRLQVSVKLSQFSQAVNAQSAVESNVAPDSEKLSCAFADHDNDNNEHFAATVDAVNESFGAMSIQTFGDGGNSTDGGVESWPSTDLYHKGHPIFREICKAAAFNQETREVYQRGLLEFMSKVNESVAREKSHSTQQTPSTAQFVSSNYETEHARVATRIPSSGSPLRQSRKRTKDDASAL